MQSNKLLYKRQYSSKKVRSTNEDIIALVWNILQDFEENNYTVAAFLGLFKAFDTIDHEILFKKLEKYGV